MLDRGDPLPHFTVKTLDGDTVSYSTIWQHRNLVLVSLPTGERTTALRYCAALEDRRRELDRDEAIAIVTHDAVAGIPTCGVVVADRWGEIAFIASAEDGSELPPVDDLLDWLHYVQIRCAECEGEAR